MKATLQRQRRRCQVRFDAKGIDGAGFTDNLSPTGMLIHSKLTSSPGSILRGQIFLPDGAKMDFEAEVRWVHKATGQLADLFQNSMGMKFLVPPSEAYFQLLLKSPTSRSG
jgi:PilZ domain